LGLQKEGIHSAKDSPSHFVSIHEKIFQEIDFVFRFDENLERYKLEEERRSS
jgi:hypothetical protein